jgi:hypothetical protein
MVFVPEGRLRSQLYQGLPPSFCFLVLSKRTLGHIRLRRCLEQPGDLDVSLSPTATINW